VLPITAALASLAALSGPPADGRGYFVGVEIQAGDDRGTLIEALAAGMPTLEVLPEGTLDFVPIARVADLAQAIAFVARTCFPGEARGAPDPTAILDLPTALPWSGLPAGTVLGAVVVVGAEGEGRLRTIAWPKDPERIVPEGSRWTTAELVPTRAPLYPAPLASHPRSDQRLRVLVRRDDIFVLDWVDRCRGEGVSRRCLRWARVIARRGDRFFAGFLPAHHVVADDAWLRAQGSTMALPAAAIVVEGIDGGEARFALIVRAIDGTTHRAVLEAPLVEGGIPSVSALVERKRIVVKIDGVPKRELPLGPELDRRPAD
jgi:hypothetical protein